MHILYIDESGDTVPLSQGGKKFLVLTGCVIHETAIQQAEIELRAIKARFYQNAEIEIKSNFLRYANPDIAINSPLKLNSREQYNSFEDAVTTFLKGLPTTLYAIVIDKQDFWQKYPSQNPYDIAYIFLLERFQNYLEKEESLGIAVIDPREGQVEKHFMNNDLTKIHNRMRWSDGNIWKKCSRVVDKLLFSQSDTTVGIQIADLYSYPIFHVFEYEKSPQAYWRYCEVSSPKLFRKSGKLLNYGLKFYGSKTKRDLSVFT